MSDQLIADHLRQPPSSLSGESVFTSSMFDWIILLSSLLAQNRNVIVDVLNAANAKATATVLMTVEMAPTQR